MAIARSDLEPDRRDVIAPARVSAVARDHALDRDDGRREPGGPREPDPHRRRERKPGRRHDGDRRGKGRAAARRRRARVGGASSSSSRPELGLDIAAHGHAGVVVIMRFRTLAIEPRRARPLAAHRAWRLEPRTRVDQHPERMILVVDLLEVGGLGARHQHRWHVRNPIKRHAAVEDGKARMACAVLRLPNADRSGCAYETRRDR